MKSVTKIIFTDDDGNKFFGEGPMQLLRAIERTGSLRAAAIEMEMAYSKANKLLKQAEANLGFPLTQRSTGGKDGGGSVLTPQGKRWLRQYIAYRNACIRENQRLYREHFPRTGCVIMASGLGKRFGGNKLMADFHGKPMFLRAVAATEGLFDARIVVTRHADVAEICRSLSIPVVLHELPHRNDTVRLGLEALGDVDCCMFVPGDQPLLRRCTVEIMLENWRTFQKLIFRPSFEDIPGSPVLFPRWAFPELLALPEGKGGGYVAQKYPDSVHTVQVTTAFELADADTPETLELLKGLCHD